GHQGSPTTQTRVMLKIAAMVGQRPVNGRSMEWPHVNLDTATWTIPAEQMKLRKKQKRKEINKHYVPLATQAVALLREIHPVSGHRRYVFPGAVDANKPASEATMNAAL